MAAFRLTGRGWRRFCTAVQTDGDIRVVFAVTSAGFGLLRISLMLSFSLLPLIANSMCFTPCYAAAAVVCASSRFMRLRHVSISSCAVRLLSVVCISLSCCAVVISMLGSHTALCCAADFVCCLCTAAAACTFDPRMSVLPVLRFLCHMAAACTAFGVVWGSHSRCLCFGLWPRGGFRMLCCGVLMRAGFLRYGLASGMRGCASAVRFFALLLHALLFFRSFPHFLLAFIPTSYFSVVALCARLCANLAFSLFSLLISLSLSSRSFLSSRYLCALSRRTAFFR